MRSLKILALTILVLMTFLFLAERPVLLGFEAKADFHQQEKTKDQKPEQAKQEKAEEKKEETDLGKAMEKRVSEGESIFDVIGIPTAEDYLPGTFEIVLLWLIPFSVIVAIVILILIVTRRRHQRTLAMIEKGIVPNAAALKEFKTFQFRWDVFLLLTGLILVLGGVGVSVFMMGHKGTHQWYTGVIPFLVGVALLVFYFLFFQKKKE